MATARESIRRFQICLAEIMTETNSPSADQLTRLLGPTGADGKWGAHTRSAMQTIEQSWALPATPLPDQALMDAISAYASRYGLVNLPPALDRLTSDIQAYLAERQAQAATPDPTDPADTDVPATGAAMVPYEQAKQGWEPWKIALAVSVGLAAVAGAGYLVYRYWWLPGHGESQHARSYGEPDPDPGDDDDGHHKYSPSEFTWGD